MLVDLPLHSRGSRPQVIIVIPDWPVRSVGDQVWDGDIPVRHCRRPAEAEGKALVEVVYRPEEQEFLLNLLIFVVLHGRDAVVP